MSLTPTFVLAVLVVIVLGPIVLFTIRQNRALRESRETSERSRTVAGVRQTDLAETVKAIARLQRAHDTTRSTVGLIQDENAELKSELTWLLTELAIRPEPHEAVRVLHATGPLTLSELEEAVGVGVESAIQDLVGSFEVKPILEDPDGELKYAFVPHSRRPSTNPDLAPLNRCLSLVVDPKSAGEGPLGELNPHSHQASADAA